MFAAPRTPSAVLYRLAPLALALALLVPAAAGAASAYDPNAPLADRLDAMAADAYGGTGPGAAVLVSRDGEVLLRKGYGMADIEMGVAVEPDMVFRLASVTKQFTAVAILMLAEEGKLSLDDPLSRFLPDFPRADQVTIEHLLTHTSGLRSYTNQEEFLASIRRDYQPAELIERFADEEPEFEPGAKWAYNNSGYFLLGAVIEKASGSSYGEFLEERIFEPLGMSRSRLGDHNDIIEDRVEGYQQQPDGGVANADWMSMTQPWSAGSILSTVDDLAKWDAALSSGKLVSPESLKKAWTSYRIADGTETGYGYGWSVDRWLGEPVISHTGGINGFRTVAVRLPEQKLFIAVLSNFAEPGPGPEGLAQRLALEVLGKGWHPKAVEVAPEVLERYVGVYRIAEGDTRTVTVEDGRLYTQRSGGPKSEAFPMSETEFFYEDSFSHFRIETNEAGEVTGMVMQRIDGEPERAELTDEKPTTWEEVELDPALLDNYLGRYELAPNFVLTVFREGDQLYLQATGQSPGEIFPASKTTFFAKVVDAHVVFELDDEGRATGLTLHQGGREIPGEKLEGEVPEAPAAPEEVELDPALLDNYVGRYELAPNFVLRVFREGDQLKTQATGQPVIDIYPESETTFFPKVMEARIVFDLDADGRATGLTLHQGGQEIPGRKLSE